MQKSSCRDDPSVNARIEEGIFPCPYAEKLTPFGQIEMTPEEKILYILSLVNAS